MRCVSCQRENPPDASFCGGCGARLVQVCEGCGRENPPDSRFCHGCGHGLVAESAPATSEPTPSQPSTLAQGRYRLGRFLGQGAFKRVHLARDERLDRDVAIATVRTEGLDESAQLRIQREAQAMGRLGDHPHIVTVYDVFEEDGAIHIVSQFMGGGDLAAHIRSAPQGRLEIDRATAVATQICRALEHAHRRGVVHRDLKPGNIWLDDDLGAKLGDFGLALAADRTRLTSEGVMVGTVAYMPPEQALGRTPDARSDLYALGATLYEMVTGRPPFEGDDAVTVISQHLHTAPVAPDWHNPEVPAPLGALILELLAKDPEARPATAAVVAGRLGALASLVVAAPAPREAGNPLDRLASGVFVGREKELERLRTDLDESLGGHTRLVLLVGEPGIGKTRTAEELTTYARLRGARVLWGRCHEGEGAPPFWPWIQVIRTWIRDREPHELLADLGSAAGDVSEIVSEIRDVLPGVQAPPSLEPEQARFRLFEGIAGFLRNASRRGPVVVVLDDLHWADRPSLELLQFVAREAVESRLLLVATYRDVELRRGHPLADTLGELARLPQTERVLLRGLDVHDVRRFIERSASFEPPAALVEAVYRETEGNPFFVHEVVRLLTSEGRLEELDDVSSWSVEIPQGVREVVGRRLSRLSARCNEVLTTAAVLGREFDPSVLARVLSMPEEGVLEGLEEAVQARVLAEVGEGLSTSYRFGHALVRETLYEELSTPRRVALHRRAGEILEGLYGSDPGRHAAALAHHLVQSVQAGDPERAMRACEVAAEWARSRQAWEEAGEQYERAVQVADMTGTCPPRRLAELLVAQAANQGLGKGVEAARAAALRAVEIARAEDDAELFARAVLAYGAGAALMQVGQVDDQMTARLEEALERLGDGAPALRARVLQRLGQELLFSVDGERRNRVIDEAIELAEKLGDVALLAEVRSSEGFRSHHEGWDAIADEGRRLVALARSGGNPQAEFYGWQRLIWGACWLGDADAMARGLTELERLAEELRTPEVRGATETETAMLDVLQGRFDEALAHARQAFRSTSGAARSNVEQWTGALFFLVGWWRGVELGLEQADRLVQSFPSYPLYRAFLAGCYASQGARNDALRELGIIAQDDFATIPRDGSWRTTLVLFAMVCERLGVAQYAGPVYDLLRPDSGRVATMPPGTACLGPMDLHLASLARLRGRPEEALPHDRAAVAMGERMRAAPVLALARLGLGRTLLERGVAEDRAEALAALNAASVAARDLGMSHVVEEALALKLRVQGGSSEGRTLALDEPPP